MLYRVKFDLLPEGGFWPVIVQLNCGGYDREVWEPVIPKQKLPRDEMREKPWMIVCYAIMERERDADSEEEHGPEDESAKQSPRLSQ